ncbi:MAG: glycosyltransferase [Candidatus Levybacteria bacterium]|nr:glycosyltransferase [Candidatus Levybacteria bacterium]
MLLEGILRRFYHPTLSVSHTQEYGSVESIGSQIIISHTKNGTVHTRRINLDNAANIEDQVKKEVQKLFQSRHKLVATGFSEQETYKSLAPRLWLDEDIVSFLLESKSKNENIRVEEDLRLVSSNFGGDSTAKVHITKDYEVKAKDLVTLDDYKKTCSEEEFSILKSLASEFKSKRLTFISATPQGGGVALMRHALIRLFNLLGVDAHWYVLKPNVEVFNITKRKFHNILQAVSDHIEELTENEEELYNLWIKENAAIFEKMFRQSHIIVIDDPQPSGLIPYIKKVNPKAKVIYRSHIQLEAGLANKKGTPQRKSWQFLWKNIKLSDTFVSHPVADFVPKELGRKKVVFFPATTDLLDGLNKPLSDHHLNYYLRLFNKFLKVEGQTPLDLRRPYIIQISRFDPSKGIPDVLESYLKLTILLKAKRHKAPQLVLTGNGSIDDPDRAPIFDQTVDRLSSPVYKDIRNDIKIVRLPHMDQLLNTLLRRSKIVLQLSTKEGFEIKVTEALMKGKPVIVYRTGAMPLQVMEGINGFVVDAGNTDQVAKNMFDLLTNDSLYSKMGASAKNYFDKSLLTIPGAIRWLRLCVSLTKTRNPR